MGLQPLMVGSHFNKEIEHLKQSEFLGANKTLTTGFTLVFITSMAGATLSALIIMFIHTNILSILLAIIVYLFLLLPLISYIFIYLLAKGIIISSRHTEAKVLKILQLTIEFIYRLFGFDLENIQVSFVHLNNILVLNRAKKFKHDDILILLPHCLQNDDCNFRITKSIELCHRCGKCVFKDIRDKIGGEYRISVVPGGSQAREAVKGAIPKLVIASACERDMTSGILDTLPLMVYGVLIERPYGYCQRTVIDLQKLLKIIHLFTNESIAITDG